ncbi:desumoylating isopeptidase 1-like isoform X2 [Cucurbita maxima]|uniref:Desumoylating isopeptidase 1-like isoform X2 n=1 Tax=Cucurbita maxima TaxID=3661 RepID=A0A6J1KY24_CUCMA|nr:desumoylating isopeptidase 1-like isoform X2 [Cucurbita maxima]
MAEEGQKVTLNVYDLSQGLARQLSTAFLGRPIEAIWHTGVVVYGNEYYFGGGIQHDPAGRTPYGKPIRTIDLGTTHVPKDIFETYLQEISPRYTAETYSLLSHNCNNFSNEVAQFLVGATIPDYILDLPNIVMSSPMGALILPMIQNLENTLKAGAVPMAPQFNPTSVGRSVPTANVPRSSPSGSGSGSNNTRSSSDAKPIEKTMAAGPQKSKANGTADPLGDARSKVQEEIGREFAAIMATGTLRASEAAALATKRVMQKYGHAAALSQG